MWSGICTQDRITIRSLPGLPSFNEIGWNESTIIIFNDSKGLELESVLNLSTFNDFQGRGGTMFQWYRLITFAVILLTDRMTERMTDKPNWSHNVHQLAACTTDVSIQTVWWLVNDGSIWKMMDPFENVNFCNIVDFVITVIIVITNCKLINTFNVGLS